MTQGPDRWRTPAGTPGPKRDDPLRREALRINGLRYQEAKLRAEHEVRSAQVVIGCRVRVRIEGLAPIQGKVVGEHVHIASKKKRTECWLVYNLKHGVRPYAKAHCERLRASEVSKALRDLGKTKPFPKGPDTIYGDGDI